MDIFPARAFGDAAERAQASRPRAEAIAREPDVVAPAVRLAEPASPSRLYYRLGESRVGAADPATREPAPRARPGDASLTPAERRALLEYARAAQRPVNAYLRAEASPSKP